MTIMFHPNKENPERLRVWDKELKIQKYFSIKRLGEKKAWKEAEKFQKEVERSKVAKRLKDQIPRNRIFNEDGTIKSLKRSVYHREGRKPVDALMMHITISNRNQKTIFINLNVRDFETGYQMLQDRLAGYFGIKFDREIKRAFLEAKRHYWELSEADKAALNQG